MLIASGIVCVILPKDKPVHLSLIHLPRIPIGSVQVIEIINQFVVEFHDCSYSCFQNRSGAAWRDASSKTMQPKGIAKSSLFHLPSGPPSACFSEGLIVLMRLFPAKGSGIPFLPKARPFQAPGRHSHGRTSGNGESAGEQRHYCC